MLTTTLSQIFYMQVQNVVFGSQKLEWKVSPQNPILPVSTHSSNLLTISVRRQSVSACDRGSRAAWKSHTFIALWESEWQRQAWLTTQNMMSCTITCHILPHQRLLSCDAYTVLGNSSGLPQTLLCILCHKVGLRVSHGYQIYCENMHHKNSDNVALLHNCNVNNNSLMKKATPPHFFSQSLTHHKHH